jgi:Exportin-5 family
MTLNVYTVSNTILNSTVANFTNSKISLSYTRTNDLLTFSSILQLLNMINYRKAQVPSTPIELKSLQNQRGCLRESLVALSERLTQLPSQQKELLVMSLADVVASWQEICNLEEGKSVFTSPQTLLDSCHRSHVDISRSKDDMGVLLSSCKRVSCAALPENVWAVETQATSFNLPSLVAMVDRALPFLAVWQAIMPGMCVSIKTIHSVLDPAMRCSLSGSSFSALYMPPISMVRRAAGLLQPSNEEPQGDLNKIVQALPGAGEAVAVGRHIAEMRVLLYQLLGQACSHKALYVCVEHSAIIADLSAILPWLENYQLSQLMKIFVESYVLNAPPIVHDIVAGFLESFLGTTFRRLSVCWSDVGAGARGGGTVEDDAAVLQRVIYRECNIPTDFGGFDTNQLENAKKTLWSELTRTYSEILSALACCKGYLALDMPTTAALQSATMLGIAATVAPDASRGTIGRGGKSKGKGKGPGAEAGTKVDTKPLDGIAFESSAPSSTDTELQLKQHKVLRRTALNSLLMSNPRYQQAVTAPFVASTVSLIGIPDTVVSRKGLLLAGTLALKCREDRRLITAVGKDAFSAALSVLLQQV